MVIQESRRRLFFLLSKLSLVTRIEIGTNQRTCPCPIIRSSSMLFVKKKTWTKDNRLMQAQPSELKFFLEANLTSLLVTGLSEAQCTTLPKPRSTCRLTAWRQQGSTSNWITLRNTWNSARAVNFILVLLKLDTVKVLKNQRKMFYTLIWTILKKEYFNFHFQTKFEENSFLCLFWILIHNLIWNKIMQTNIIF